MAVVELALSDGVTASLYERNSCARECGPVFKYSMHKDPGFLELIVAYRLKPSGSFHSGGRRGLVSASSGIDGWRRPIS